MITEDNIRRASAKPAAAVAPSSGSAGPLIPARIEKLTRIQAVGARNLTQSWQQVPHFVQMVRVYMSRAMEKRRALNASGGKTTITDLTGSSDSRD